jgi:hypothetical protein
VNRGNSRNMSGGVCRLQCISNWCMRECLSGRCIGMMRSRRSGAGLDVFALFACVTRRARKVLSYSSSLLSCSGYTLQCNHVLVAVGSRRPCRHPISQHLYLDLRSRQPCLVGDLPDSSLAPTPTLVKQGFMPAQRRLKPLSPARRCNQA